MDSSITIVPPRPDNAPPVIHGDGVFTSRVKITQPILIIPPGILAVCRELALRLPNDEWSILCKGSWKPEGYTLDLEYAIPRQEVNTCNVYFDDASVTVFTSQGFNTVIHCHPFSGSPFFSSSDLTTLSATAECSILYQKGTFPIATIAVPLNGTNRHKLIVSPKIQAQEPVPIYIIPEDIFANIRKQGCASSHTSRYPRMTSLTPDNPFDETDIPEEALAGGSSADIDEDHEFLRQALVL